MKYLLFSVLLLTASLQAANNCTTYKSVRCQVGELELRSGACVTDCGCFLEYDKQKKVVGGQSRFDACVANQLGKGKHNYYAEIPSDCLDCIFARKLAKSNKTKKSKNK